MSLVAAALIAVAGLTACGESENPDEVISKAFNEPHTYDSGRLDAKISLKGAGLAGDGGLSLGLQGPWKTSGKGKVPSFEMDAELGLGGRDVRVRLISDGKAAWVDFSGLSYALPQAVFDGFESAYTGSAAGRQGGAGLLDRLGFSPGRWIKSPEVVGDEKVGGVETVHVKADIDVRRLTSDLVSLLAAANSAGGGLLQIPGLDDKAREQLGGAVDQAEFNLWAGTDGGEIRKVTVVVRTRSVGPLPPLAVDFSVELTALNEPQEITIPKNAQSFEGLAGLLAGVAGLGGGGEGSANSSYSDCVSKAKDADAVAKCTEELVQ